MPSRNICPYLHFICDCRGDISVVVEGTCGVDAPTGARYWPGADVGDYNNIDVVAVVDDVIVLLHNICVNVVGVRTQSPACCQGGGPQTAVACCLCRRPGSYTFKGEMQQLLPRLLTSALLNVSNMRRRDTVIFLASEAEQGLQTGRRGTQFALDASPAGRVVAGRWVGS